MSSSPSSPPDDNPQNPELSKAVDGNGQDVKEVVNDISERPFSAPVEPMREDQVQNAVNFLSHPRVRGSPVIYRRSFLEKKGLTKEEIDEAFRRVPDPPSNASTVEAASPNQAIHPKSSNSVQSHASVEAPQLAAAPGSAASVVPSLQQATFQWSQALIATGVLAASGAGTAVFFKNVVVPRLKAWIRKVVAEENESVNDDKPVSVLAEQTAEAAKAAATAAAIVAKASEELLNSKAEEKKYFEAFVDKMDVQVKEMKTMGEAIRRLESRRGSSHQEKLIQEYIQSTMENGTTNYSWETSQAGHSDASPSSVVPKLWEIPQQKPSYSLPSQPTGGNLGSETTDNGLSSHSNGKAEHTSEPWWKRKTVKITEIESGAEQPKQQQQQFPYNFGGTESRPSQRRWVPPQPPTVVIPEAAAAIRQPKSSIQKQQSGEMIPSDNGQDAAIRPSAPHGSGVESEASGSIPLEINSEIEEEREGGVEVY